MFFGHSELWLVRLQVDETQHLNLILPHLEFLHVLLLLRNHDLLDLVVVFFGHFFLDEAGDVLVLFIVHQRVPVVFTDGETAVGLTNPIHE